jgi:hypothetical protein
MPLSWILNPKIKDGYLNEYKELIVKLNIVKDPIEIFKIKTRLKELVIYPQEVAECKRIGIDIEATDFFRKKIHSENKDLVDSNDLENVILSYHGKYIDSLVPEYNKKAIASHPAIGESCLSFNGSLIGNNYTISYILKDEAFEDHAPAEMLEYANKLEYFLVSNEELDFYNTQVLKGVLEWLRFWSSKGFGFRAIF